MELSELLMCPVGTSADFTPYRGEVSQKKLSAMLSGAGWKKDYNHPGTWERVCVWPYLTLEQGKKVPIDVIRRNIELRSGGRPVQNKDVPTLAGVRMTQAAITTVMTQIGYKNKCGIWEK